MAHHIESDQEDDNLRIGRTIHEESYVREVKEIELFGSKIDILSTKNDELVIGEIKKSSKNLKMATKQLLFYLYQLKKLGIKAKGEIKIPLEKKVIRKELSDEDIEEIENVLSEINTIIEKKIPAAVNIPYCKNCSYSEFCWTD